jgi:hypothetical protein
VNTFDHLDGKVKSSVNTFDHLDRNVHSSVNTLVITLPKYENHLDTSDQDSKTSEQSYGHEKELVILTIERSYGYEKGLRTQTSEQSYGQGITSTKWIRVALITKGPVSKPTDKAVLEVNNRGYQELCWREQNFEPVGFKVCSKAPRIKQGNTSQTCSTSTGEICHFQIILA